MSRAEAIRRQFASDNNAGICPAAWRALEQANRGHAPGYGEDEWTARAADQLRQTFETDCEVYFVFNGTAANALALASLGQSYHSVLCHEIAHVETDECGAAEFFSNGMKILQIPGEAGKVDPAAIERRVKDRSDIHYPKPRVVSVTQSTELGTVYSPDEIAAIGSKCREHGLALHMDGARFANAVASLGVSPRAVTWQAGVDLLCFGSSKNGSHGGEAVIFFRRELAREFDYRCKQAGQLCSKMRFLAAPWLGMLEGGVWLENARHANAMAQKLAAALSELPQVRLMFPTQANAVFAELPVDVIEGLWSEGWRFYTFIGRGGCRLMCAWDTAEEDVERFAADVSRLLAGPRRNDVVASAARR